MGNNSYHTGLKTKRGQISEICIEQVSNDTKYVMFLPSLKFSAKVFIFIWNCPECNKFVMKKWGKRFIIVS